MENYAHPINQISLRSSLKSGLLVRQLVVGVKAILDQENEEEEGIQHHYQDDDCSCILVFTPVLVRVAQPASDGAQKFFEAPKKCRGHIG